MFSSYHKKFIMLICSTILLGIFSGCQSSMHAQNTGYIIQDYQGTSTRLLAPPQRILNYSFWLDDMVLGLVPPNYLVGINHLADDPNSSNIINIAQKIPIKINNPSAETILSLHPDVVFVDNNTSNDIVQSLRSLGVPVIVCKKPQNTDEVENAIRLVASTLQLPTQGSALIKKFEMTLANIRQKISSVSLPVQKKVIVISMAPTFGGKNSLFDCMCQIANVRNGTAELGKENSTLSKEQIIEINPDFMIIPVYNDHGNIDIDTFNNTYLLDPALQTVKAIKNKHIYQPHEGYIYNASQDMVFGAQDIAHGAYPDLIEAPIINHLSVSQD